jgi:hypothetical protein
MTALAKAPGQHHHIIKPTDARTQARNAERYVSVFWQCLGRVQHLGARVAHCRAHPVCECGELLQVLPLPLKAMPALDTKPLGPV